MTTPRSESAACSAMRRASSNVQKWWMPSASLLGTGSWAGVPPVATSSLS